MKTNNKGGISKNIFQRYRNTLKIIEKKEQHRN